MKIAISQPRYLPAVNYIQRIFLSDVFVLLDDVQHSREFETRNKILTPKGPIWLTIPCRKKTQRPLICELDIDSDAWIAKHYTTIIHNYKRAPHFDKEVLDNYFDTYDRDFTQMVLNQLNYLMSYLEFKRDIILSSRTECEGKGARKLYNIARHLHATDYISGVNGKNYIQNEFSDIRVHFHIYPEYEYPQLWHPAFHPWMCFFDTLFNLGKARFLDLVTDNYRLAGREDLD